VIERVIAFRRSNLHAAVTCPVLDRREDSAANRSDYADQIAIKAQPQARVISWLPGGFASRICGALLACGPLGVACSSGHRGRRSDRLRNPAGSHEIDPRSLW